MLGFWAWIFSRHGVGSAPEYDGPKPSFLYTSLGNGSEAAYELGFTGLPAEVGLYIGIPVAVIGLVTMIYGEVRHYGVLRIIIGGPESFSVLGDVLSYLRIAAVILAKAGMAFVVNMLFFGVYVVETESGAEWHFGTSHAPQYMLEQGTYHGHEVKRSCSTACSTAGSARPSSACSSSSSATSSSSCSVSRAPACRDPPRVRRILQQVLRGRRPRVQSLRPRARVRRRLRRPFTSRLTVFAAVDRRRTSTLRYRPRAARRRVWLTVDFDRETSERVTLTRGIGKCNIPSCRGSAATTGFAIWFGKFYEDGGE